MRTVRKIIKKHGGIAALKEKHIRIENDPFMPLVIEWVGKGPYDMDMVSVAHYYKQNGDMMRDPEIVFLVTDPDWLPYSYQQDALGLYQQAIWNQDGKYLMDRKLMNDLSEFAKMWDRNIKSQGFILR